jgi:hypothetical protein
MAARGTILPRAFGFTWKEPHLSFDARTPRHRGADASPSRRRVRGPANYVGSATGASYLIHQSLFSELGTRIHHGQKGRVSHQDRAKQESALLTRPHSSG